MLHLNYTSVSYLMARKDVTVRIMLDDDDLKTAVAPFETNGGKEQKKPQHLCGHIHNRICVFMCVSVLCR